MTRMSGTPSTLMEANISWVFASDSTMAESVRPPSEYRPLMMLVSSRLIC